MKNTLKLTRVYPDFSEPAIKKIVGKSLLGSVLPIEPLMELMLLPAPYLVNQLRQLTGDRPKDYIEFTKEEIIIREADKTEVFLLKELQDLKINYSTSWHRRDKVQLDKDSNDLAKVSFKVDDFLHEYYYDSPEKAVQKICKALYSVKYKFKEYRFGKRVFLGKQPNYKKVQELKLEYGIEW